MQANADSSDLYTNDTIGYEEMYYQIQANNPNDTILWVVDKMPEWPSVDTSLMSYFSNNFIFPKEVSNGYYSGRISILFVIERDGSISNTTIEQSLEKHIDKECIRVISNMPKWKPGTLNGIEKRVFYLLPINIDFR